MFFLMASLTFAQPATPGAQPSTPGAQPASPGETTPPEAAQRSTDNHRPPQESKRILGIIPNYRTSPSLQNYEPLTNREKFKMASRDAFDRGTFAMEPLFAAEGQLPNSNQWFGQGADAFGKELG